MQAEFSARANIESLNNIKVRNARGQMAPITQFMTLTPTEGPDNINRFNMFTSISINGNPADGYTSGQAIQAVEEVAKASLPVGYTYEYSGLTREEQSASGSTTAIVFGLCFLFIYLLLAAQYESYLLPLAVLLSVPFGLLGSFLFIQGIGSLSLLPGVAGQIMGAVFGEAQNNIYVQIALIMLVGLLAKNAILIVEFALDRRKAGMSITTASLEGAAARLRPILMTSMAMIIGLLPMMFAFGVGANGNRSLGTTAIGGMLIGMICQIFVVPALFRIFQGLQERIKPIDFSHLHNNEAELSNEQPLLEEASEETNWSLWGKVCNRHFSPFEDFNEMKISQYARFITIIFYEIILIYCGSCYAPHELSLSVWHLWAQHCSHRFIRGASLPQHPTAR